ncbi:MAG: response regulator [Pirellulaceae bacterium]
MSNILLVEDSPTQAMQMKLLLESAAHDVTCCDDGTSALAALAGGTHELVVTDLELPVLNGLDLIKQMQLEFSQIPTVLVTGQGSERLAAEALRVGATAYVPKSMVDDLLIGTVEDVLGVTRTDRSYAELIDCTVENRLVFELPNKMHLMMTAIDLTMQLAGGMELLSGVDRFRVATALQHAGSNAIHRGNLELTYDQFQQRSSEEDGHPVEEIVNERLTREPYRSRKVHFDARLMRDLIRIVIRDEGPGFKVAELVSVEDPRAMDADHGRGLTLIRKFMDKVSFNDSGNEITMVKHCIQK